MFGHEFSVKIALVKQILTNFIKLKILKDKSNTDGQRVHLVSDLSIQIRSNKKSNG